MSVSCLMQLDYLLRIAIAAICGTAIGYERKNRMKEAGIRTHFIVAVGAALIMIVSKYGFQDQIGWQNTNLDPSRIAAQVVTGVGFLGAGIIFMHRESIKGLTTAAGIWVTAGIGLAIGSGLYFVGGVATIVIILGQVLLHSRIKWLSSPKTELLLLEIANVPGAVQEIHKLLTHEEITLINFKAKTDDELPDRISLEIIMRTDEWFDMCKLICTLQDNPLVKSAEF